jgi:hypothetical protein
MSKQHKKKNSIPRSVAVRTGNMGGKVFGPNDIFTIDQWCTPSTSFLSLPTGTVSSVVGNVRRIYANVAAFPTYIGFGIAFALSELDQASTLENLFDFYRINSVTLVLYPAGMMHQVGFDSTGQAAGSPATYIQYVQDYNEATAPTSQTQLSEYSRCKQVYVPPTVTKEIKCRIVPRLADVVFNSTLTVGYSEGRAGQWCSTDSPGLPHFGFKAAWGTNIANTAATMCPQYDIRLKYNISFKNVR